MYKINPLYISVFPKINLLLMKRWIAIPWLRLPADILFIVGGVLPLLFAVISTYFNLRKSDKPIGHFKNPV
jgi:hypothetical protein